MRTHGLVIATGPGAVRRLCCATTDVDDTLISEMSKSALAAIDDPVALIDERPMAVDALWCDVLRLLECGRRDAPQQARRAVVVHPSWWAASRVRVVAAAARILAADTVTRPRSWLLTQLTAPAGDPEDCMPVVVEIADRFVVVTGPAVIAASRTSVAQQVADEVVRIIVDMTRASTATVLIDGPTTVAGAPELARLITGALHRDCGVTVVAVDDAQLAQLAELAVATLSAQASEDESASLVCAGAGIASSRTWTSLVAWSIGGMAVALVAVVAVVAVAVGTFGLGRHEVVPAEPAPTTVLVEGRIALTVPAHWPVQRVVTGPGSARIQVTSPSDPEAALHVTQSPVAGETLSGTAERLKRAIDQEPVGVFVDFHPSDVRAGRPAVTYREVRPGHDIAWTVLLEGTVRISVGCQSRPAGQEAIREVCEQAVRSARAWR